MNFVIKICLIFLLAQQCHQTPLLETTELDEELVEATTQAEIVEKTKDDIIAEQQSQLTTMKRHVAAFKSKSQADAAKVQSLNDLVSAYESQIDSYTATIGKLEANVKNLNDSVNSYQSVFSEKELEITDLKVQTRADATNLKNYKEQITSFKEQLRTSQASSCLPFGNSTAIHLLHLPGGEPFFAPCESRLKEGSGWTVIQRRLDGSVNFYRNWTEYREGFGDLSGELFIGLDKLHRMTSNERHELLIHYQNFGKDSTQFFRYDNFSIGNEREKYKLKSLGGMTTQNGQIFSEPDAYYYMDYFDYAFYNNLNMKFTTYDQDNDNFYWQNCAKELHGAWWFDSCGKIRSGFIHLNGIYDKQWKLSTITIGSNHMRYVEMLIRPYRT